MRKYRLEQVSQQQSVGVLTWVALGITIIILLSVGGYFGYQQRRLKGPSKKKEETAKDPLDITVRLDLQSLQVNLADVLTAPRTTTSLFKSSEVKNYTQYNALELYNIFAYNNVFVKFLRQYISCFDESQTNPRLALNITRNLMRLVFVAVYDVKIYERREHPDRVMPIPGSPQPSKGPEILAYTIQQYKEGVEFVEPGFMKKVFVFFPYLVQFMFENNISSLSEIAEFDFTQDSRENDVTLRNQEFVDLVNFMQDASFYALDGASNNIMETVFKIDEKTSTSYLWYVFRIYSTILRALNNTYDVDCTKDIRPTLQEEVRTIMTTETISDLKAKGVFRVLL
jgi:hypothetical protein